MKKVILQTALFAYINSICFRNFKPTSTKISELYNKNIIVDSKCSCISHDKLQRLLQMEQKWNLYLKQKYGHLLKKTFCSSYNKLKRNKTFLIIDDTVVAKPFSKELDALSWIYSSSDKKYLYGLNTVFIIWTDGNTRFPIGFRLLNKDDKKSRIDLAMDILKEAKTFYKVNPDYVLMDSFYPAAKLLKLIRKFKWHWVSKIKSNRLINGVQIKDLFTYRYGNKTGLLYKKKIKVTVVKENNNYWATSDIKLDSINVKKLYRKRQIIEEFFKILKSELRIEGCPSRTKTAQLNHIYFVLFAFCQLEDFRIKKNITTIYKIRMILFECIIQKNLKWSLQINKF